MRWPILIRAYAILFLAGVALLLLPADLIWQTNAVTVRYIAATAGTFTGGTACNGQTAITPTTWNGTTLSAGDIAYICGTITGTTNTTILTPHNGGSSGNPIVLNFDTGAILQEAYCSGSSGCINLNGLSFVTINGQNTGTIQNTANGDGLANQQISIGIYGNNCTNCTVENLTIANIYIAIKNFGSPLGGAMTQMNAIYMSGSNWLVTGNTIHDCGWCLYNIYANGDTNTQITSNEIYHWDHAIMYATSAANACTAPCLFLTGNKIHDNINFETAGCVYHLDGLHTFGTTGSTMNGMYISNNYWYGSLSGACSSGFIFMEQGSSTPSHARNTYVWDNVFDATNADGVNPNGWVGLYSGEAGVTQGYNNTLLCPSSTDGGTVGWGIQQQGANTTFENNLENKCPQGNAIIKGSGTLTVDYNAYGNPCNGTSNCWVWAGTTFEGSFSAWKTACSCDAHSQTTASDSALLINSDGSLQSGSPAIGVALNQNSVATGNLASLLSDTTKGGSRTPSTWPISAAWDEGSYCSATTCTVVAPAGASAPWFASSLPPSKDERRMVPLWSAALFPGKHLVDDRLEARAVRIKPLGIQNDGMPSSHSFRMRPKILFVGQVLADDDIASRFQNPQQRVHAGMRIADVIEHVNHHGNVEVGVAEW
jgi:hypothetical protein